MRLNSKIVIIDEQLTDKDIRDKLENLKSHYRIFILYIEEEFFGKNGSLTLPQKAISSSVRSLNLVNSKGNIVKIEDDFLRVLHIKKG